MFSYIAFILYLFLSLFVNIHENHPTVVFFLFFFCLVAVYFNLAGDGLGGGGPFGDNFGTILASC